MSKFIAANGGLTELTTTDGKNFKFSSINLENWKKKLYKEDGTKDSSGNATDRTAEILCGEPNPKDYTVDMLKEYNEAKKAVAGNKAALKQALASIAKTEFDGTVIDFCIAIYNLAVSGNGELEFSMESKAKAMADRILKAEQAKIDAAKKKAEEKAAKKASAAKATSNKKKEVKVESSAEVIGIIEDAPAASENTESENVNASLIFPAELLASLNGDLAEYESERGSLLTEVECSCLDSGEFPENLFIDLANNPWMKEDLRDPAKLVQIKISAGDRAKMLIDLSKSSK